MLSILMIEQDDLLLTQLQYKTTLKYIMRPKRSTLTMKTLRERIEADMDFRIPGLPHSVVKHAQSTSVRQLFQKIENHPNRHALQQGVNGLVTKHDADVNDNIHDCVALHDAYTTDQFH